MYVRGGVNFKKFKHNPGAYFNGIKLFTLEVPVEIFKTCLELSEFGKRVNLPGWKSGRTVPTKNMPDCLLRYYAKLCDPVSQLIGERVYTTALNLPTSCALLTYDQSGDFINWHYDVNYFNGRFFTLLIMIDRSMVCDTNYVFRNPKNLSVEVPLNSGDCILFEGDVVYHAATPLGSNQFRHVLSLQFSTDPSVSFFNNCLMSLKDKAYV